MFFTNRASNGGPKKWKVAFSKMFVCVFVLTMLLCLSLYHFVFVAFCLCSILSLQHFVFAAFCLCNILSLQHLSLQQCVCVVVFGALVFVFMCVYVCVCLFCLCFFCSGILLLRFITFLGVICMLFVLCVCGLFVFALFWFL